jgi:streptogramin lyase
LAGVRRPLAIAAVVVAALCVAPGAAAATDVRLPLGSQFNGLAVAPDGQVWVSGEGRRTHDGRPPRGRHAGATL